MPLETAQSRTASASELALPPPFSSVRLREVGDAFAHAASIAAERGAGTLVYVGRFDLAEFAVVVEPDEPLMKGSPRFLCRDGRSCGSARRPGAAEHLRHDRMAGFAPGQSGPRRRRASGLAEKKSRRCRSHLGWFSAAWFARCP